MADEKLPALGILEVSAEYIEHEKEILMAQIQNDPKDKYQALTAPDLRDQL